MGNNKEKLIAAVMIVGFIIVFYFVCDYIAEIALGGDG